MRSRILTGTLAALVMLFSLQAAFADKPGTAPDPSGAGTFDRADFIYPDYGNRDTETLEPGTNTMRTLSYSCHCAREANCFGTMSLQVDMGGSGIFTDVGTPTLCDVRKNTSCDAQQNILFDLEGTFEYRIECSIEDGTSLFQDSRDHILITVEEPEPECLTGMTRLCPLQEGVCSNSEQKCVDNKWLACDYASHSEDYEPVEHLMDGLDNDCDGTVDEQPPSGNQVVVTGADDDPGKIAVYQYGPTGYEQIWSYTDPSVTGNGGGGKMGDLNGDGDNEVAVVRYRDSGVYALEIWDSDSQGGLYRPWALQGSQKYVAGIRDIDDDGSNELVVSDQGTDTVDAYQYDEDSDTYKLDATVLSCDNISFIKAVADLNGNGIPEIVAQCEERITVYNKRGKPSGTTLVSGDISIVEFDPEAGEYVNLAQVPSPVLGTGGKMLIDDMEAGDVNRDEIEDVVFCGNSGQVHVLSHDGSGYQVIFSSSIPKDGLGLTQSCGVGKLVGDDYPDFYAINDDGLFVFSDNGSSIDLSWRSEDIFGYTPGLGISYAGDADNDGAEEILFPDSFLHGPLYIWHSDGSGGFTYSALTTSASGSSNVIVGPLIK